MRFLLVALCSVFVGSVTPTLVEGETSELAETLIGETSDTNATTPAVDNEMNADAETVATVDEDEIDGIAAFHRRIELEMKRAAWNEAKKMDRGFPAENRKNIRRQIRREMFEEVEEYQQERATNQGSPQKSK